MLVLLMNLSCDLYAQQPRRNLSFTLKGGTNLFYGDVENHTYYKSFSNNSEWELGYGLDVNMKITPYLDVRGSLGYGSLTGTKRKKRVWFMANLLESSLNVRLDVLNIFNVKQRRLNPYFGVGLGMLQYRSILQGFPNNEIIARKGYGNGRGLGGMTFEGEIPMFAGVDIFLSDHFDLQIESDFHLLNSDELDVKKGGFKYDIYGFYSLGITYHLTKKKRSHYLPRQKEKEELAKQELKQQENDQQTPEIEEESQKPEAKPVDHIANQENEEQSKNEESLDLQKTIEKKERKVQLGKPSFENVLFYVQVAASQKPIDKTAIAKRLGYPEKSVSVLRYKGWYKYVVGGYKQYWEAKNQKNILISNNIVDDAFVVATKNNAYITVNNLLSENSDHYNNYSLKKHRSQGLVYSIQILATKSSDLEASGIKAIFNLEEEVFVERSNGLNRYTVGSVTSVEEAVEILRKVVDAGISDAFMVAYKNGVRVPLGSVSE
jgi:hypothetical protein